MSAVILGIDPGFDRLGWAVGQVFSGKLTINELGTIVTNRKQTVFERYQHIQSDLQGVLNSFHPTELAIESLFFSSNKTTALRVSETRGVIIGQCLQAGLSIHEYNPTQIKQVAAGSGRADKHMMAKMIGLQIQLPDRDTLDDAIDAVAVVVTHSLLRTSERNQKL